MSLWEKQSEGIAEDITLRIENGYVSLVRGHMRLNVGKYGRMAPSDTDVGEVNTEENLSEADHAQPRRGDMGGGSSDGRFQKGPWASTGYGMDDEARTRGRPKRRKDDFDID